MVLEIYMKVVVAERLIGQEEEEEEEEAAAAPVPCQRS